MSFAHAGGSHQNSDEPVCLAEVAQDAIGAGAEPAQFRSAVLQPVRPDHWVEGDPRAWPRC
jgi:hypothetical protein